MLKLRDMPPSEQPRERLIEKGPGALSDAELVAVILRVGIPGQGVLELSKELVSKHSLKGLLNMGFEELAMVKGLGKSKACELIACSEIARRLVNSAPIASSKINSPADAVRLCNELQDKEKEYLVALYVNSRHAMIKKQVLSIGNLNTNIVDPREIFKHALRCNAYGVVLLHNHPSGEPEPSDEDIEITRLIADAGRLLNILLIDHVIISSNGFTSLNERKMI
jgi:DNA repair protein RadC